MNVLVTSFAETNDVFQVVKMTATAKGEPAKVVPVAEAAMVEVVTVSASPRLKNVTEKTITAMVASMRDSSV